MQLGARVVGRFGILMTLVAVGAAEACVDSSTAPPTETPDGGLALDAGTTDSATPPIDAAPTDTSVPDTATPDVVDTGVDAGPTLDLGSTATTVNADGAITLTATLTGATATAVTFTETTADGGAATLGTDGTSPFTQDVPYTFLENGPHTYVASVDLGGGNIVKSAPLVVTVNISPNGFFVDPVGGSDANTGTQASPYKTIAKAATGITAGQTIYLAPGTYDTATQTTRQFTFNVPVFVRTVTGVATLVAGGATTAFTFNKGGGAKDLVVKDYSTGMSVTDGTFVASNIQSDAISIPFALTGTAVATIDNSALATPFTNVPSSAFAAVLLSDGAAQVSYKGGTLDGPSGYVYGVFARGHSTLTVESLTLKNMKSHALVVYDNAHVKLKNVTIDKSGLGTSSGLDKACVPFGGQNTEQPMTTSLELIDSSITGSTGPGIGVTLYNYASTQSIKLTNSHVDGSAGGGIVMQAAALNPSMTFTVDLTGSTLSGNTGPGLSTPRATVNVTGGAISGNTTNGIVFTDVASVVGLKMRGVTLDANLADFVSVTAAQTSTIDLGTAGDLGGNVFSNVPVGKSALTLTGAGTANAIGNTWMASQQGADATGKYTTSPTVISSQVGRNVSTTPAGSVTVD